MALTERLEQDRDYWTVWFAVGHGLDAIATKLGLDSTKLADTRPRRHDKLAEHAMQCFLFDIIEQRRAKAKELDQ